ncbi:MAG: hypothetical protein A2283_18870 [Lentisphaerae bacterium RIFOXYA12_FULL_48_11]|nr:MAG: hypothetical protein A2283_18870 [Lentisphaerae bacterium RIFOXYA12_FULL_48_11]
MSSLNKVLLIGNLTKDPELRPLKSGMNVANMRLAISEKYKSKDGKNVETVCYVDVEAWSKLADICGQYLTKGSPVMVEGMLKMDEWEKDGQKRSKLLVRANNIEFLGKSKKAEGETNQNEPAEEPDNNEEDKLPF